MTTDIKNEVAALNLGSQIRNLRTQRGYTLEKVSNLTGLSKPHLSQIENDIVSPPIATLLKISGALGVKIGYFFQDSPSDNRIVVTRKEDRANVREGYRNREFSNIGYKYELLANQFIDKYMEPFVVYMEPRKEDDLIFNNHRGEEFVFVLKGQLEFHCGEKVLVLNPGDSLYFDAKIPHAYRGINDVAQFVGVLFSPTV